jgi:hypothetical protein
MMRPCSFLAAAPDRGPSMLARHIVPTSLLIQLIVVLSSCGGGSGSGSGSGGRSSATGGNPGATGGRVGSGGNATSTGGTGNGGTGQPGTGGAGVGTGGGGAVGTGGSGTGGRGGAAAATGGAGGGTAGGTGGTNGGAVSFNPDRAIITGVRGVATPAATRVLQVHNSSPNSVSVTALTIAGTNATLFQVMSPPALPASIAAGADLPITVQLLTNSANLPAAPAQDSGATDLTATLNATLSSGSVSVGLYGLVLTMAIWEPTLGQILNTLGYRNNVGLAQNNANPNRGGTVQQLPGIETGPTSDEIAAPRFLKAGAGLVTLLAVARFSPVGPMPFGWYPSGNAAMRNMAGTMAQITDAQTSDKARMVMPPVTGSGTFDPGTQSFGVWVYSDQLTGLYSVGTPAYGDYDYSEDAPNLPANVHRTKVYPLHDSTGATVANTFLLAVEEAANGDYQDYVFVLGNARVAP